MTRPSVDEACHDEALVAPEARRLFAELLEPGRLQAALERSFGAKAERISVGLSFGEQVAFASLGRGDSQPIAEHLIAPGCMTKLLTGALLQDSMGSADLWQKEVRALLEPRFAVAALDGVRPLHLLEHTHGLDDSLWEQAPRTPNGSIDIEALLSSVALFGSLTPVGRYYSYSNLGAWLGAAILEHQHGRSFSELLIERLLAPLGCSMTQEESQRWRTPCPALGESVQLTLGDMLTFVRGRLLDDGKCEARRVVPEHVTPYPGWNALERGICLGWKHYGEGWFGHQSTLRGANALIRANRELGIALVLSCESRLPATVAGALFGTVLPEYRRQRPKALDATKFGALDLSACEGTFERHNMQVRIARGDRGLLELRAYFRTNGRDLEPEPYRTVVLQPATQGVFFTHPPEKYYFQVLEFLREHGGPVTHLWNGRYVWRRTLA